MKRRTKIATVATATLAGVAMVSVGFASWVISNQAETKADGNITVDVVTDNSVTLSASATNQNLYFGKPADMTSVPDSVSLKEYKWLSNNSEKSESLTVTISLKVSANIGDITYALATGSKTDDTFTADTNNKIETAVNDKLISYAVSVSSDQFEVVGDKIKVKNGVTLSGESTFNLIITFSWGDHFGNMNPYFYYNSHEATETLTDSTTTYKADAIASLGTVDNGTGLYQLNSSVYQVTFSAEAKD